MTLATFTDFAKWEADAANRTEDELEFIVKDCRKASEAMRGWNVDRENFYADQAFTYGDELVRRRRAK